MGPGAGLPLDGKPKVNLLGRLEAPTTKESVLGVLKRPLGIPKALLHLDGKTEAPRRLWLIQCRTPSTMLFS